MLKTEPWGTDGLQIREISEAVLEQWLAAPAMLGDDGNMTNWDRVKIAVAGCLMDANGQRVFASPDIAADSMTRAQMEDACMAILKLSGMWRETKTEPAQELDPNAEG